MPRILITRITSFGDVAMLVPVVYSVAARYPHDRFVVLTRKAFNPLFENLGFNVSAKSFDTRRHKGFFGLLKLTASLMKGGYSCVADMHDVLRTKFIRRVFLLRGKKVRYIDKGRGEKKELLKNKNTSDPINPTVVRYMKVFEALGYPADMSFTNFFEFRPRSLYPLRFFVTEKKGTWIGIAPFSKHEGKIYPLAKTEKVIRMLLENPDNHIFLFASGANEKKVTEKWEKVYDRRVTDVSSKLNLDNELLLISYLDVMFSMDSANMHLASLVEVPVVSVWGATHPSMGFYGFKQDPSNAVQIDLPCRPCSVYGDLPCYRKDYACMNMIAESIVAGKINEVLSKRKELSPSEVSV